LAEQQPLIDLVDKILSKKQEGRDTKKEETQIDQLVYQLYELTEAEMKIIENV
jgi:adenine-specific DNA-methyltransferase